MTFKQDWDAISVAMLQAAPSKKPVISHYPPSHMSDLEKMANDPASRLCGPIFATSDLESQIIRLEGASVSIVYSIYQLAQCNAMQCNCLITMFFRKC
jgi:hypothetical protein